MTKMAKREELNRQSWIKIMNARDIREQLRQCFRRYAEPPTKIFYIMYTYCDKMHFASVHYTLPQYWFRPGCREGVNHQENCKEVALAYIDAISKPFVTGGLELRRKKLHDMLAEGKPEH